MTEWGAVITGNSKRSAENQLSQGAQLHMGRTEVGDGNTNAIFTDEFFLTFKYPLVRAHSKHGIHPVYELLPTPEPASATLLRRLAYITSKALVIVSSPVDSYLIEVPQITEEKVPPVLKVVSIKEPSTVFHMKGPVRGEDGRLFLWQVTDWKSNRTLLHATLAKRESFSWWTPAVVFEDRVSWADEGGLVLAGEPLDELGMPRLNVRDNVPLEIMDLLVSAWCGSVMFEELQKKSESEIDWERNEAERRMDELGGIGGAFDTTVDSSRSFTVDPEITKSGGKGKKKQGVKSILGIKK